MPWFVPYNLLDDDQRFIVNNKSNNKILISGFAGTGKSVLLVHKLIEIYRINPNAKCCVISFTHALLEMFKLGIDECGQLNGRVTKKINVCGATNGQIDLVTKYEFRNNIQLNNPLKYDFILMDEVQDLCKSDIKNVKSSQSEIVYFGGDDNQSIYYEDPKDKEPTLNPNEIQDIITIVKYQLNTLYRLTPSILKVVKLLMPELIDKLRNVRFGHNRDTEVLLAKAIDEKEEVKYIVENALIYAEDIELTAILLPAHTWIKDFIVHLLAINSIQSTPEILQKLNSRSYTEINSIFHNNNIRFEYVGNEHGSFRNARNKHNVVIMTYHSAKGMDFDNVFVPFLSSARNERFDFFLPRPLMVAFTRSNFNLTISFSGDPMDCVKEFKRDCVEIEIGSESDTNYFDF